MSATGHALYLFLSITLRHRPLKGDITKCPVTVLLFTLKHINIYRLILFLFSKVFEPDSDFSSVNVSDLLLLSRGVLYDVSYHHQDKFYV